MTEESRAAASARIARTLEALPELATAPAVAGYWPMADEVDLVALWQRLHGSGAAVHLPRIDPAGAPTMDFVHWDPDGTMTVNRFGVPEPSGTATPVGSLDVVVLPCTAVDDSGTRVGMGAGFYDRALRGVRPAGGSPVQDKSDLPAAGGSPVQDKSDRPGRGEGTGPLASRRSGPKLVTVAFAAQLIHSGERIRRRAWDVPADLVITESATIRP